PLRRTLQEQVDVVGGGILLPPSPAESDGLAVPWPYLARPLAVPRRHISSPSPSSQEHRGDGSRRGVTRGVATQYLFWLEGANHQPRVAHQAEEFGARPDLFTRGRQAVHWALCQRALWLPRHQRGPRQMFQAAGSSR